MFVLILSACGNNEKANENNDSKTKSETITYQSETGPIEIPKNPKRIIALSNGPNVLALEGNIVGIDQWTNMNPLFQDRLKGVEVVSEDDLEKIIELEPDLIIAGSEMKNIGKLNEIAPTVVFTWGKLDYLSQQIEIGKLLNKEKEAKEWVKDFENACRNSRKKRYVQKLVKMQQFLSLKMMLRSFMYLEIIMHVEQKYCIKQWT
ncbi:ABC transporter substrate-binding protein [Peribacillus frigoritolerans]|nr:ABC transporter substrate-binding protein [Peribacillus frigoritolerans]